MPSVTCEISITNKFRDTKFFLFQEVPKAENGPSGEIFSNVFKVTDSISAASDGSSTLQLQMDNDFYAIFGSKVGGGTATRINTSSFRQVKLGPGGSVVAVTYKTGTFKWDDVAVVGRSAPNEGGFQFISDDSIPTDTNTRYIGVGVQDPDNQGKVVPIATYLAEPSLNSMLYPKMTYYVATGSWQPGQLVDRNAIGKYVKVDFEGAKIFKAVLTLQSNGNWVDEGNQSLANQVKVEPHNTQ
ncbi:hypothetical protein CC78DRAFT_521890 [Lojkania enalia]|uniref:Uncharacterized protein n=1 Tax=Lojkania enalia TaxID=147567 RepID=A0A9P4K2D5_9PLEO|nr:hypothetical protein CC78DRAFT_521890 [Didymosphaeria enalia]